jgi:hypothetical protein
MQASTMAQEAEHLPRHSNNFSVAQNLPKKNSEVAKQASKTRPPLAQAASGTMQP